jgi:cobalt-zinc-cadmium efflux system outer membrane protein
LLLVSAVAADSTTTLTEARLLTAVVDSHAAFQALHEEVGLADAARREAGVLENPSLSFATERSGDLPRENVWSLAWVPPIDGRRGLRIKAADAFGLAAQERLKAQRLALRLELREAFASWFVAEARAQHVSDHAGRVESLVVWLRARAQAGEVSGLEARRLNLELAQLHRDLATATAESEVGRARVSGWIEGLSAATRPARPPLPEVPGPLDTSARGDLAALAHEIKRQTAERKLSGRVIGAPELYVGWQTIRDDQLRVEGPVAGFEWSIPILDRAQGRRARAEARLAAARARLASSRARAEAELAGAIEGYDVLREAALDAAGTAADAAILVEGAGAAFRVGETGLMDLIDTLRTALGARLSELELIDRALAAHRGLEAAAGRPLTDGDTP